MFYTFGSIQDFKNLLIKCKWWDEQYERLLAPCAVSGWWLAQSRPASQDRPHSSSHLTLSAVKELLPLLLFPCPPLEVFQEVFTQNNKNQFTYLSISKIQKKLQRLYEYLLSSTVSYNKNHRYFLSSKGELQREYTVRRASTSPPSRSLTGAL